MTASAPLAAIDLILKASAILAGTACAALLLRRSSAAARHLLWTLGLAGALAIPLLSTAMPRWQLPLVRVERTPAARSAPTAFVPASRVGTVEDETVAAPRASEFFPTPSGAAHRAPAWPVERIVLFVWMAGTLVVLGRLLLGLGLVALITRRTREVTDAGWLPQARVLAAALGLRRVRFIRGRTASMPMACGVFRAAVLMPGDADGWPDERLRIVLLHELAHVKRRDCLTHAIAQLACAAYWFNPLVWIAAKRLRVERERACDDLVLRAGTRRVEYANQLLAIARVMHEDRFPVALGGATLAMAHRSQLEGRLMAILDPSVPRRALSRLRVVTAVAAAFGIVLVLASVQPWAQTTGGQGTTLLAPASTAAPAVQPTPAPQPPHHMRRERGLESKDVDEIRDRIRDSVREGVGAGVGTGVGIGADIASDVVATVVQSVATGIATGIPGGVSGGVTSGVTSGVIDGVTALVDGVTSAVQQEAQSDARSRRSDTAQSDRRDSNSRAATALMEALKDSDKGVRRTALAALVNMHDPRAIDPLTAALKDSDADVRKTAVFGLGELHDARAVRPLASALKDEDAGVRKQAAFALGQLHDSSAVDPLLGALNDSNVDVRAQVVFALGQLRDPRAVDGLSAALKDSNPSVRRQAAFALGQIR